MLSKPEAPEGHYSEFVEEDGEEFPKYCLSCGEQIEIGDKIYVDPSVGNDNGEWVIIISYWHQECWDAMEDTLDKLEGKNA